MKGFYLEGGGENGEGGGAKQRTKTPKVGILKSSRKKKEEIFFFPIRGEWWWKNNPQGFFIFGWAGEFLRLGGQFLFFFSRGLLYYKCPLLS